MEHGSTTKTNESSEQHEQMVPGEASPEVNHQKAALDAVEIAQKEILYIRAEFENYKKRIQKEQDLAIRFANRGIILDLLNVLDFFDRAAAHGKSLKEKNDKEVTTFVSGVEMTRQELLQLLQRFGVEIVGNIGEKFDPELHEAVTQLAGEGLEEFVAEVIQKGGKLQGKLIKPARVVVGRR